MPGSGDPGNVDPVSHCMVSQRIKSDESVVWRHNSTCWPASDRYGERQLRLQSGIIVSTAGKLAGERRHLTSVEGCSRRRSTIVRRLTHPPPAGADSEHPAREQQQQQLVLS